MYRSECTCANVPVPRQSQLLQSSLAMGVMFSQIFPPSPRLTERNLPSQKGKVFIVTGGASGVGLAVSTILYQAGGKVYIAGRSEVNARQAIAKIKSSTPGSSSPGQLEYLQLRLDDLSTIKSCASTFQSRESRLDVLFNNAGVSLPPLGSVSAQGYELQLATNCLGPFLFTSHLIPVLKSTAKSLPLGLSGWSGPARKSSTSPHPMGASTSPTSLSRHPTRPKTTSPQRSATGS